MNGWRKLELRLRALFQKRKLDAEMDDEMRSHIEMQTQENLDAGMNPEEARYAALRQFGWVESIKQTCRERRGVSWIEHAIQDFRYGLRMLLKNPGFTGTAVLTLALGIGASTSIYSVVNSTLLNPIPGRDSDRLMQIAEQDKRIIQVAEERKHGAFFDLYPPVLEALRANRDLFTDIAWADITPIYVPRKTGDFTERVRGAHVSPHFFALWNVKPVLGRTFTPDEAAPTDRQGQLTADSVVVISHSFWQSRFGGDADVIGKSFELTDQFGVERHFTVIGVMPPHFSFPLGGLQFWIPVEDPRVWSGTESFAPPSCRVFACLKPGVTEQQAQAMLDVLAHRLKQEYPASVSEGIRESKFVGGVYGSMMQQEGWSIRIRPVRHIFADKMYGGVNDRILFCLLATTAFVLLIACANVANLMMARTERRQQELAIRGALGAGRGRLMRQMLTESVILAGLGGLAGLVISVWGMRALVLLLPQGMLV